MAFSGPLRVMPECWKDDKRMNSLFAPFRKKELNPIDWESKMLFWHSVIEKWCLEKNQASFSVHIIQSEFKRNGKTPVSIDSAVQELIRQGEVRNKAEFLSLEPSQSWTSWAVDSFVKLPVSWSISKLKNYWSTEPETLQPETEFVHLTFLKEKGEKAYTDLEKREEDVISYKDVGAILAKDGSTTSQETIDCIVQYLRLQGLAVVQQVGDTKVVKILKSDLSGPKEITEVDLAVFRLQQNKSVLELNLQHLEDEKDRCIEEAKAHLKNGLERSAKNCLRKKKQLEKCIEKRSIALDNLESLLASLHNTASDSKVVDAYKVGLSALKGTLKSSGLSEDGVFETMAQLQEMNDIQDEIQMAISQPIGNVAEEDLEQELENILTQPDKSIELPDVPNRSLADDLLLLESSKAKEKQSRPEHQKILAS